MFLPTRALVSRFADLASTQEISRDERVGIWRDSLQLISAYKWTGCGFGSYEHSLYRHKTVAPTKTVDFAHNDYVQILSELGIVGFIAPAVLMASVFKRAVGAASDPDTLAPL
jgi:O-antigen ligase